MKIENQVQNVEKNSPAPRSRGNLKHRDKTLNNDLLDICDILFVYLCNLFAYQVVCRTIGSFFFFDEIKDINGDAKGKETKLFIPFFFFFDRLFFSLKRSFFFLS